MARNRHNLNAPLEELLERARSCFGEVVFERVELSGGPLDILQIKDMPAYIDKLLAKSGAGGKVELPLWARVWPTNIALSLFLEKCPFPDGAQFLEIGAGIGLAGLTLARRGFTVTISDLEPDALLFCRINALRNGLGDQVRIEQVDFTKDRLERRFQAVIGCEILFREVFFAPLAAFVAAHLDDRPDAEVILGSDGLREGRGFFQLIQSDYDMMRKDVPYTDTESGERKNACLYRLRRKAGA
ncbi:MAG: methyltransferase [Desulfovibrionaceae bacterium]